MYPESVVEIHNVFIGKSISVFQTVLDITAEIASLSVLQGFRTQTHLSWVRAVSAKASHTTNITITQTNASVPWVLKQTTQRIVFAPGLNRGQFHQ